MRVVVATVALASAGGGALALIRGDFTASALFALLFGAMATLFVARVSSERKR